MRSKQSGFTLVEIAIVLVIIGLLLGGVLKGQELINSAKVKNIANDLNGIASGVYAYQDRYKAFPGDDKGAARWTGITAGDGNGIVGDSAATTNFNDDPTGTTENVLFWAHMKNAGFVAGDKTSNEQPRNTLGGIIGVQTGTGLPAGPELGGLVVCTSNLTGKIAEAVDLQFDDGTYNAGTLRGYKQGPVGATADSPVAANGATSSPARAAALAAYDATSDIALYTICKSL